MIDIHSHLLPGVDDGVKTMEESVACCRLAWEDGTRTLVATPHMKEGFYDNDRAAVLAAVEALQGRLDAEGIGLKVVAGSEVYFAAGLTRGIRDGRLATLADGGRYLLLELPYNQQPVRVEETVFELKVAGVTPIMAHPERVRYFQENLDRLETVIRQGALSQLTTTSLTGGFGGKVEELSLEMVRRRMVHFLASDAHDARYRPPLLSRAVRRLSGLVGEEAARATVEANPLAVLRGEPIDAPEPLGASPTGAGGSVFRRLWGRLASVRGGRGGRG